jgi:hypothetical protein
VHSLIDKAVAEICMYDWRMSSSDGTMLAAGDTSGFVTILHADTLEVCMHLLSHSHAVSCITRRRELVA